MNEYDDLYENQGDRLSKEDYAARKQAEREGLFALSNSTAPGVAGDGGKFRQYLDVQSKFYRYGAVNALLILAQKPESTRLADFGRWKSLGGFVKPGQSAISILEPTEYTKDDGTVGSGYNVKKVFDISQVSKVKADPPPSYTDRQILSALISKAPMKISAADNIPDDLGAMTDPKTGEITVRKGMAFADTFRSLAQELAYAHITRDSANTHIDPYFSAYCTSYILCMKYGVDTKGFNFADAPGTFAMIENLDAQIVKRDLSQIRDAADNIASRMARQLDAAQKAAKMQEAR